MKVKEIIEAYFTIKKLEKQGYIKEKDKCSFKDFLFTTIKCLKESGDNGK